MATPKPGDWYCPGCNDLQFARNAACRRCGTPKDDSVHAAGGIDMGGGKGGGCNSMPEKPGDWYCPSCNDLQFARNVACRRCGTPKPREGGGYNGGGGAHGPSGGGGGSRGGGKGAPEPKQGDWYCPNCGDLQFARNQACRRCATPNPFAAPPPVAGGYGGGLPMMGSGAYGGGIPMQGPGAYGGGVSRGGGGGGGKGGADMRPGDWNCPECGDLQFAKNAACRRCGCPKPRPGADFGGSPRAGGGGGESQPRPGDWYCGECGDLQFAKNAACRRCGAPPPGAGMPAHGCGGCGAYGGGSFGPASGYGGPPPGGGGGQQMRPGDWNCPQCGDLQFAKNSACRRCGAPKPGVGVGAPCGGGKGKGKQPKPGDWNCPQCGDLQFARNDRCRMCGADKPEGAGDEYGADRRERSRSRDR